MFTGIVQAIGRVRALTPGAQAMRLGIDCDKAWLEDVALGDSIAVSGVCLTVTAIHPQGFDVDVSPETLRVTTLGARRPGDAVNLEKALRLADRLGGHLVSGHVDGIGEVLVRVEEGECVRMDLALPEALARYVCTKGSIAVDGVSLTVNSVADTGFSVQLIPHTLAVTTLGRLDAGDAVNLEVDLVARYLERLMAQREDGQ